jgi:hypothetical protein
MKKIDFRDCICIPSLPHTLPCRGRRAVREWVRLLTLILSTELFENVLVTIVFAMLLFNSYVHYRRASSHQAHSTDRKQCLQWPPCCFHRINSLRIRAANILLIRTRRKTIFAVNIQKSGKEVSKIRKQPLMNRFVDCLHAEVLLSRISQRTNYWRTTMQRTHRNHHAEIVGL